MKRIDVGIGGNEMFDLPKNHPDYGLINADSVLPEHYKNARSFLGMIYKKITRDYIIGQNEGVFGISRAVRNHVFGIHDPSFPYVKVNPLIIGPTGVGKTRTVQEAARLVGLPYIEFSLADVTPLPIKGGMKLPQALEKLISNTNVTNKEVIDLLPQLRNAARISNDQYEYILNNSDDYENEHFLNASLLYLNL